MQEDELSHRMAATARRIEETLDQVLSARPQSGEIVRPPRLLEAMRYACLGGGKRLRPFLVIETARAFGCGDEGLWRAAAAVELVHCYSLVHDDLPAMDDDDLRRGRPTVHKAYDEATAVLVGDSLLTLAFDVMADPATDGDGAARAALVLGLARASGLGGMAGGQALDLEAETAPSPLDLASVRRLQAMKTGALLAFSVEAGLIKARAQPGAAAALRDYGRAVGAAFQIADDLLDAAGDEAAMGKRIGKDADRNKATFVAALGVEGARRACADLVGQAQEALARSGLGRRGELLSQIARFTVERKS